MSLADKALAAATEHQAKFQIGPWKLTDIMDVYSDAPVGAPRCAVRTIVKQIRGCDQETLEANARLIAAAPDLAAALQATLNTFRECIGHAAFSDFESGNHTIRSARAALAKAGL